MTEVLASLQASGFSTWLRESESIWALPTVLTVHTIGLGVLVGSAFAFDLRVLGMARSIPLAPLTTLFPVMWAGFWLSLATGSSLFAAYATTRGSSPVFYAKLVFVCLGVSTVVLIKRSVFDAPSDVPAAVPVRLLALLSLGSWTAAITSGRLLAYLVT